MFFSWDRIIINYPKFIHTELKNYVKLLEIYQKKQIAEHRAQGCYGIVHVAIILAHKPCNKNDDINGEIIYQMGTIVNKKC